MAVSHFKYATLSESFVPHLPMIELYHMVCYHCPIHIGSGGTWKLLGEGIAETFGTILIELFMMARKLMC